jgi:hypothetical protein
MAILDAKPVSVISVGAGVIPGWPTVSDIVYAYALASGEIGPVQPRLNPLVVNADTTRFVGVEGARRTTCSRPHQISVLNTTALIYILSSEPEGCPVTTMVVDAIVVVEEV